jgi:anti-anti-sigma factor
LLAVSFEHVAGAVVVRCAGEVDMANAQELCDAIDSTAAADVIVDIGELRYLDSSGIRAIEQAFRRLRSSSRSFALVAPPQSSAQWTYRVYGCDPARLWPTVDAALASFHRGVSL